MRLEHHLVGGYVRYISPHIIIIIISQCYSLLNTTIFSFMKPIFAECALTCNNGGTRNASTCQCICEPNWTGNDCSGT